MLLSADVRNLGSYPAQLAVGMRLEDADGESVASFGVHDLGRVAVGGQILANDTWNTASYRAGNYVLRGAVLDAQGARLAEDATLFAITAGKDSAAPIAGLTLATDRAIYMRNDTVRIDNLVRNLVLNATIDNARVLLTVRDPYGTVVFTHTEALGQLAAGSVRALDTPQTLRDATIGTFSVEAVLLGSGNGLTPQGGYADGVRLISVTASYEVVLDDDSNTEIPGSGDPESVTPIPVDNPLLLFLTMVLLVLMARNGRRQVGRRPGSHGADGAGDGGHA